MIWYLWFKSNFYWLKNTNVNLDNRQTMYRQFGRIWTKWISQKSGEQFSIQDSRLFGTWFTYRYQENPVYMAKQKKTSIQKEHYIFYIQILHTGTEQFTFNFYIFGTFYKNQNISHFHILAKIEIYNINSHFQNLHSPVDSFW